MSDDLESLLVQLRQQGPRQFAAWNDAAFESYVNGPLSNLQRNLSWRDKGSAPDVSTPVNFLHVIFEGVGAGWLRTVDEGAPPATFLAHCVKLLPHALTNAARKDRSKLLQQAWNLGEGLAREPQWVNQYAITRTDWSTKFDELAKHLEDILAPVLTPLPAAKWQSGFRLSVLDFRPHDDNFLPGRIYLASPAVLCVEDRLTGAETLGILLQKKGESAVLGSVGKLPEYKESFTPPTVNADVDRISVNGHSVSALYLQTPQTPLCVASGFVAVAAEDSQRLWLVEAA